MRAVTETAGTPSLRRWRTRRSQHSVPSGPLQEAPGRAQKDSLEGLKHEVARELGLEDDLADPDRLSVREAGKIGGRMVRRLVRAGRRHLAQGKDGS